MNKLLVALAAVAVAVLSSVSGAAAHPNEFELRIRINLGLAPGPPGPAPAMAERRSSKRVHVLGHANPGGFNADVVVHRGHAYLGSWGTAIDEETYEAGTYCPAQGVRTYSLFDPTAPALVATFADGESNPLLAGSWTEKVIVERVQTKEFKGDLAAVSFQDCRAGGFRGIGLYDVSDPGSPVELALYENGVFGVHELDLEVRDKHAYVHEAAIFEEVDRYFTVGTPGGDPEYRIIDVTDPRNPAQVGGWSAWTSLGIEPVAGLGSFPFNLVHSVIVEHETAYVSYWDLGTVILDVSDPAAPRYIGRTSFAADEEGNAHSAALARGGKILIQADEDFDPGYFTPPGTEVSWGYARIFDISNPATPVQLSTFELATTRQFPPPGPGDFTVHDPKVVGNTLYLSHYAQGVMVVDISRPAEPEQLAQFLPTPAADPFGLFFPGDEFPFVWGVFPERNFVVASDINSGLWVFEVR
jgi:hypothetical protein